MALFKDMHPDLIEELDLEYASHNGINIDTITCGSNKKALWTCGKCGGKYTTSFFSRHIGQGCPYCAGKKVLAGYNDLKSRFPLIAAEWDYEKNSPLTPEDVTPFSNKKAFWICPEGHSYEAAISTRSSRPVTQGCPYCSGKKVLPGYNDLATKFPLAAAEWDVEKNVPFTAQDFTPFSSHRAYWICAKGHSYDMPISRKTSQNQGCPYCGGKRVLKGFNDLASKFPELIADWDYEKNDFGPDEVTYGSEKKAHWKCHVCGHEWVAAVNTRSSGEGCAVCGNIRGHLKRTKSLIKAGNSIKDKAPWLLPEWDYEKNEVSPEEVTCGSNKKVFWICPKGHSYSLRIADKYIHKQGCPYCAGKKVLVGFNDLESQFPDIAADWDYEKNAPLTPKDITYGSKKTVYWKCRSCGRSYSSPVIEQRARAIKACPTCRKSFGSSVPEQIVYYYIKQVFPDAVNKYTEDERLGKREIDIFIPNIKVGIEYDGMFWHANTDRDAAKTEIVNQIGVMMIRLRETYDMESAQQDPLEDFSTVIPVFRKDTEKDYQFLAGPLKALFTILSLFKKYYPFFYVPDIDIERDTPIVLADFMSARKEHSLQECYPEIAKELHPTQNHGLKAENIYSGSSQQVWWQCSKCGREWKARVSDRTGKGYGCIVCNTKKSAKRRSQRTLEEQGSFAENYPEILKEWDFDKNEGIDPNAIIGGSSLKVWWKCKECGYEWKAAVKDRTLGHQGCQKCGYKRATEKQIRARLKEVGSLADVYPHLLDEWDYDKNYPLTPETVTPHSQKKVWWKCPTCGHEWQSRISTRTRDNGNGSGCPECYKSGTVQGQIMMEIE